MTRPAPARYDLRWTGPNVLALGCLCAAALGALATHARGRPVQIGTDAPMDPRRVSAAAEKINPNRATIASLVRLPAIGPAMARAIIEHRQAHGPEAFRFVEDLSAVRRIGPATVAKIAPYLSLPRRPSPASAPAGGP